jgi:hypothetical protein
MQIADSYCALTLCTESCIVVMIRMLCWVMLAMLFDQPVVWLVCRAEHGSVTYIHRLPGACAVGMCCIWPAGPPAQQET